MNEHERHHSRLGRVLGWPARRPWVVLGGAAVLCVLALFGAMRMSPSASLGAMMGSEDPAGRALGRVLERFDSANELLVLAGVPEGVPEAQARAMLVGFAQRLEAEVGASVEARALCKRVAWRADPEVERFFTEEVVPAGLYFLDDAQFEAFRQRLEPGEMRAQMARNEAALAAPGPAADALAKALIKDPLRLREFLLERLGAARPPIRTHPGGDEFIAPDGRSLLIRLTGARPSTDLDFAQEFASEVGRLAARANTQGLTVDLSGAYAIAAESARSIKHDMLTSDVWAVVLMQVLFLLAYRNVYLFLLTILPCAAAILLAFGVYIPFSPHLSPLSAVIGAAVAGQGIDYCIHYLNHFERARAAGDSPEEAADHTGRRIGPLLLAASGTAMIAFLAVLFSGVRALRDFAALGVIGLAFSLAAALVLLPAMVVGLERVRRRGLGQRGARFGCGWLLGWIERHRRVCIAASLLLLAGAGMVVVWPPAGVGFETDLTAMHPRPNRPLEAQQRIGELFGGAGDSMVVHMEAPDGRALAAMAHEVDRRLRSEAGRASGVVASLGPANLLPDPAAAAQRSAQIASIDAERVVADFGEALAESIFEPAAFEGYIEFLRELLTPREPPGLADLRRYPSVASQVLPASGPGRAPAGGAEEAIAMVWFAETLDESESRARAVVGLRGVLAGVPGATATGIGAIGHDLERAIRRELPRSLGVASGAVLVALLLYFRRPADVALALVPVVFGVVMLLAFMRLTRGRFNMANLVAMPLLVGLAVDNGIFLTGLARDAVRRGQGPAALAGTFAASGHATIVVSATTILAFGSMVFTSVPAIGSLGRVFAVGITASLVSAFFLLMPLLLERAARKGPTPPES
jgi:predicted RND superfamily exporter protein